MIKKGISAEEKIKIVELHIRDGIGYGTISRNYDIYRLKTLAA